MHVAKAISSIFYTTYTFTDERIKILYALSFMCGGMAQVGQ